MYRVPYRLAYGLTHPIDLAAEHPALRANVHDYLVVPDADRFFSPILATVSLQLVAYHMSVARGIGPDFPRNLSKTLKADQSGSSGRS